LVEVLSSTVFRCKWSACSTLCTKPLMPATRFSTLYYPHFPVLETPTTIACMYQDSYLLFWTIISIVLSRPTRLEFYDMWDRMNGPFVSRFKSELFKAPVPLRTIQAILLQLVWPLPIERQIEDPTWLYCGVAINAALYMGIHSAKPARSLRGIGVQPGSMRARALAWLGCFLSSTQ
jgi:hypothetical protein